MRDQIDDIFSDQPKNVSEAINSEHYKWERGDFVIIDAGTGSGKSYFVQTELYERAKEESERILVITNRNFLKKQYLNDTKGKRDVITVVNYQEIENAIINKHKFNFDLFKYVVCDECHYFLTDSKFNRNNDRSLNAVLKIKHSVVIFMSATGSSFFRFIREEYKSKRNIHPYYVKRDYSRISELAFFNHDETIEHILPKVVKENEKVLYFCNNVERIYTLSTKFNDSLFIFSDPYHEVDGKLVKKSKERGNNDKYAKHLNREAIKEIIQNKKLNHKYTFTTTTLDNGVDFIDKDLRWIIIDNIRDFDTIIQCIGRKRFFKDDESDKIYVLIRNVNNMELGGMKTNLNNTLKAVNTFLKEGTVDGRL